MKSNRFNLLLALLVMLLWQRASGAASLETAAVEKRSVIREEVFDAVVEAVNKSTVSAQTSGRVVSIDFDVDDYVAQGSVILRLSATEQRAVASAAEARYSEAQAEFIRVKELQGKQLVARSAYDKAEAELKSAAAALEQAREQAGYTVVRAPYSGIVVERHIEVGEMARPGQPLMTGISLDKLRVSANVPQSVIHKVRALGRARVLLPGRDTPVEAGRLTISPHADPESHTFKVRIDLPKGLTDTYPGTFAKVAFATEEQQGMVIPSSAVVRRSEVTAVYAIEGDKVSFRQVRIGRTLGDGTVEVLAGLDAGEQVAVDPVKAGVYLKGKRGGSGS